MDLRAARRAARRGGHFDSHTAILEGSGGAIVRRVMVIDDDYPRALAILRGAGELPAAEAG